jgi:hypothetical protein
MQTLSHALDGPVALILNDSDVRAALCGKCTQKMSPPSSAEKTKKVTAVKLAPLELASSATEK